jgi:hypothetical protein
MDQEDGGPLSASIRVIKPLQVSPKVSLTLVLKIEGSLDWEIWNWSRLDAAFVAFAERHTHSRVALTFFLNTVQRALMARLK